MTPLLGEIWNWFHLWGSPGHPAEEILFDISSGLYPEAYPDGFLSAISGGDGCWHVDFS